MKPKSMLGWANLTRPFGAFGPPGPPVTWSAVAWSSDRVKGTRSSRRRNGEARAWRDVEVGTAEVLNDKTWIQEVRVFDSSSEENRSAAADDVGRPRSTAPRAARRAVERNWVAGEGTAANNVFLVGEDQCGNGEAAEAIRH